MSQWPSCPTGIGGRHCGSLWSAAHIFSWKDQGREIDRGRGDTSPRHQWAFTLSLRYLFLLCFWASSIKYETLRQKEGEWKGWERGPQRIPLNAFEEALRRGVSWAQMYTPYTNTYTPIPPKWCGQIRWQISAFASCVFRSLLTAIPQKGLGQCN